ncbi:Protein phosphatase 2C 1 [Ascosphaera acerosa]|nr:Protein phosphatase 2C 1 [Ascosphaera acerosa]
MPAPSPIINPNSMRTTTRERMATSQLQRLGRADPALLIPQGALNNSAGDSSPTLHSSFLVGVAEDKNKRCRRTMEDAHAFIYNFLGVPRVPARSSPTGEVASVMRRSSHSSTHSATSSQLPRTTLSDGQAVRVDGEGDDEDDLVDPASQLVPTPDLNIVETDNGFFAIYDGHAGSLAADWCGKKVHLIVEDRMRAEPDRSVAEILDESFREADRLMGGEQQLRNSGCTAVAAVLRWEDRIPPRNTKPRYKDRGRRTPPSRRVAQWAQKEAERLFILSGAVF